MSSTAGRQSPFPSVLAIFGPTASGKSAVAEAIADRIPAELVSADSMQVYRGLPILTNQDAGARLVGIWPLDRQGTVGEFQALAHEAIDEIVAAGRTAVVVGGSGLWFQAALTDVRLPPDVPAGRASALGAALRPARGGDRPRSTAGPRSPCRCPGAPERPEARRAGPGALAGGRNARAGAPSPLERRAAPSDPRRGPRRPARDAGGTDPRAHGGDVRAGSGGGGACRGRRRSPGARPRCRTRRYPGPTRSSSSNERRNASPPTSGSGCVASPASS